jgi:hypothetical protein
MEGMDADCYVVEYAIRDRLLDAREKRERPPCSCRRMT